MRKETIPFSLKFYAYFTPLSVQIAIAAPTGTAATSIYGKTIHSLLRLLMKSKEFKKLDDLATRNFQLQF